MIGKKGSSWGRAHTLKLIHKLTAKGNGGGAAHEKKIQQIFHAFMGTKCKKSVRAIHHPNLHFSRNSDNIAADNVRCVIISDFNFNCTRNLF
jgi:hypothetical protein